MKEQIINFLCKMEGWKTACKNMHFSSDSMSEHKLFDEIAALLNEKQDEFGEICQGIHGQFGKNTIKNGNYQSDSSKKFIQDIVSSTKAFYKELNGDDYVGLRSSVEDFLSKLDKLPYLLDLCLKEDFKRYYKAKINEDTNQDMLDFFNKWNNKHKLTPYSQEDRERNFTALTHGTPEERNPSYANAKKNKKKNESIYVTKKQLTEMVNNALRNSFQ